MKIPGKAELEALASRKVDGLILEEIGRARLRIAELQRTYPSAPPREVAQRLVDAKKTVSGTAGILTGLFGLVSIPADLIFVTYLQVVLLVELATLFRANLKSQRGRDELLDLLGYANGVGPVVRAGPKLLGRMALAVFDRGGLPTLGRAFPVVAAPITAYLNNRSIEHVGEEGIRFYARR